MPRLAAAGRIAGAQGPGASLEAGSTHARSALPGRKTQEVPDVPTRLLPAVVHPRRTALRRGRLRRPAAAGHGPDGHPPPRRRHDRLLRHRRRRGRCAGRGECRGRTRRRQPRRPRRPATGRARAVGARRARPARPRGPGPGPGRPRARRGDGRRGRSGDAADRAARPGALAPDHPQGGAPPAAPDGGRVLLRGRRRRGLVRARPGPARPDRGRGQPPAGAGHRGEHPAGVRVRVRPAPDGPARPHPPRRRRDAARGWSRRRSSCCSWRSC